MASYDLSLPSRLTVPTSNESISLALIASSVTTPFKSFCPTRAQYNTTSIDGQPGFKTHWTARNNRKGRHAIILRRAKVSSDTVPVIGTATAPRPTSSISNILIGIRRIFTCFPLYDISYDIAALFTIGSAIWVLNGIFAVLPFVRPGRRSSVEALYGGGVTALVGGTIFQIGGMLLMLETINENSDGCFGWAIEQVFDGEGSVDAQENGLKGRQQVLQLHNEKSNIGLRLTPSTRECTHHQANKQNLVGARASHSPEYTERGFEPATERRSWSWLPSTHDLRVHYIHSLAFYAALIQLVSTTVFYIPCFAALPPIWISLSSQGLLYLNYLPQLVGGLGFVVSGVLFTLETQKRWWKPAPRTLGWWIGAWNLVGGVGFALSPAFGLNTGYRWAEEQSAWCTLWGSIAFLIGSSLQLYESLAKWSVEYEEE